MYLLRSWPTTIFLGLMLSSFVFMASCGDKSESPFAGLWGGKSEDDQTPAPICETDRSACVPIATGTNLLQNSGFDEQREDNDWILKPTENGSMGEPGWPTVVTYDVRGEGEVNPSLAFRVGQQQYVEGTVNAEGVFVRPVEGAILYQEILVDDWQALLEVTVDVAVEMAVDRKFKGNEYGGKFELMVDQQVLADHDFGRVDTGTPLRRTLTARIEVAPGPHEISLAIRRPMRNHASLTQYIDNFRAALAVEGPAPIEEEIVEGPQLPSEEDVEGPPAPVETEQPVDGTEEPLP